MPEGFEPADVDAPELQFDEDKHRLAQLGYKQELLRSWSGFSNFVISFSIISILAGSFTTILSRRNLGGHLHSARVSLRAPFDPGSEWIRA